MKINPTTTLTYERLIENGKAAILAGSVLEESSGCWLWARCLGRKGYGNLSLGGKTRLAHRVSYEVFVGPPGTLHVLHRCDTPACVNPDHLFRGTNFDNIKDSMSKGRRKGIKRNRPTGLKYRMPFGAHDVKLKIRRQEWPAILARLADGEKQKDIAAEFSVDPSTISHIKSRMLCAS